MGSNAKAETSSSGDKGLKRGLSARHVHFIALGSAIGTGLFYGSADAIQSAGPAVLLVYLLGGAVVYFMLRALGEMAVRMPVSGSFAEYCRIFLGPWSGYITGWMYAFEMVIVCLADLTAIGTYMRFWFPDSPQWVWVAVTLLIVGAVNITSSRLFGELEFGLTIIKVSAVVAMFAFGGSEIIGVTAGDAEDPAKTIPKAIHSVPIRILLFYVLAIAVIVTINPWSSINGESSPFVQIFNDLGVNWAAALLNVVVITAALSAINSDLFGAGRVVHGMAAEGLAPRSFARTSAKGVPIFTTTVMLGVLVIGVVINFLIPERVFLVIAALATFATVFVWLMILLAHLASRTGDQAPSNKDLTYPVPLWPWGQYFALAMVVITIIMMMFSDDTRLALVVGVAWTALMSVVWVVRGRQTYEDYLATREAEKSHA
ncbi:amino acid permease [Corynebacterium kroppenstedtii]|uniref:amino acid permease n=1 Tax=Corynebacterium kroppenstedtii TaxID=161879 RepID=UPI0038731A78